MPGRSRSSNGSAEATLERALKFILRSDFVRKCQSRPHTSSGPRASSHRRPEVKVSLAAKGKVQIGLGTLSPFGGGEGWGEGAALGFMVPMHAEKRNEALPARASRGERVCVCVTRPAPADLRS